VPPRPEKVSESLMKKEMCHTDFSTARVDGARGSGKMTFIRNSLQNPSSVLSPWPFRSLHADIVLVK
jgi:hypothetical protein